MTQRLMRVCVIGAGVAGLCCALAAASRGLRVHLLDEAAQPGHPHAHIEVVPSMLRDLVALGVGDDCVRAGFAYHGIDVIDRHGRHLFELPTQRLTGPRFPAALGIRHADLHQLLERAAIGCGVLLSKGVRVLGVQQQADRARVDVEGRDPIEADLVVLASGAGSALAHSLFPQAQAPADLGQAWWYTLVSRPVTLDRPLIAFAGSGHRAVLVPVRHDLAGLALSEPRQPDGRTASVAHLRQVLGMFPPQLRSLGERLDADAAITLRPARSGLLALPWHRGAVLAVGECAHCLPPHFGQAAAQAVEDARVLADLLGQPTDRATLFAAFEARRAARVQRIHEITQLAARWDLQPDGQADLSQLMERLTHMVAQPA